MKDIYIRTLTGAVFLVLVIGSLLVHPLAFFGILLFFNIVGLNEFFLLIRQGESRKGNYAYFIVGIGIYVIIGLIGLGFLELRYAVVALALVFMSIAFEVVRTKQPSWQRLGACFAGYLFVTIPFALMNALYFSDESGNFHPGIIIGMLVIIWSSDVFAYLVGSMFGKHRLHERISPKKSWEGSLGGLVFAMIAAYILSLYIPQYSLFHWFIMAAIIVVAGSFGDLAESLLKREAGAKDSGKLFPGHGGVLDRFDAVLLATPFVFAYINLV